MYLKKKIYIGANYKHRNVKGEISITIYGKPVNINFGKVSYIEEQAAYWRKANAIHKWFVDNCQNGVDDCEEYSVGIEDLRKLLNKCEKVIKLSVLIKDSIPAGTRYSEGVETKTFEAGKVISNAKEIAEILPTQEGFFFGSEGYDEIYLEDVKYTVKMLKPLLAEDSSNFEFYYQSSW